MNKLSGRTCSVPGCAAKHKAYGLCLKHYRRATARGEVGQRPRCSVDGCDQYVKSAGLCSAHYQAQRRYGTPIRTSSVAPLAGEMWVPISGFEGYYEVSSLGRVRSLDRVVEDGRGVSRRLVGKELRQIPDKEGYRQVYLRVGGVTHTRKVHRLVALAFLGPCPDGYQANHRDGDKGNNAVSNLEWVTPSENINHAYQTGLIRR